MHRSLILLALFAMPTQAAEPFTDCPDCPAMIEVPAGAATLGSHPSTADRRPLEGDLRQVEIQEPFALGVTEVTRGQFRAFVEATGHQPANNTGCNIWNRSFAYDREAGWRAPGYAQGEDHPVVCVSFADAEAYAAWLVERTGQPYRLPSSTEFEYALRAGSDAPWPWGTDSTKACAHANVADRGLAARNPERMVFACDDPHYATAPVGKFTANGFGLYDMIGNAWEWTADCFHDTLDAIPLDGSAWGAEDGGDCAFRTPRGGAWVSGPDWARATTQSKDPVDYRSHLLGFRVARDL